MDCVWSFPQVLEDAAYSIFPQNMLISNMKEEENPESKQAFKKSW